MLPMTERQGIVVGAVLDGIYRLDEKLAESAVGKRVLLAGPSELAVNGMDDHLFTASEVRPRPAKLEEPLSLFSPRGVPPLELLVRVELDAERCDGKGELRVGCAPERNTDLV